MWLEAEHSGNDIIKVDPANFIWGNFSVLRLSMSLFDILISKLAPKLGGTEQNKSYSGHRVLNNY